MHLAWRDGGGRDEHLYPYAVAAALLALSCKDERIRQLAIVSLREVPTSGKMNEDLQYLLRTLQSEKFADAAPPEYRST